VLAPLVADVDPGGGSCGRSCVSQFTKTDMGSLTMRAPCVSAHSNRDFRDGCWQVFSSTVARVRLYSRPLQVPHGRKILRAHEVRHQTHLAERRAIGAVHTTAPHLSTALAALRHRNQVSRDVAISRTRRERSAARIPPGERTLNDFLDDHIWCDATAAFGELRSSAILPNVKARRPRHTDAHVPCLSLTISRHSKKAFSN
jgi:hypothetical protein